MAPTSPKTKKKIHPPNCEINADDWKHNAYVDLKTSETSKKEVEEGKINEQNYWTRGRICNNILSSFLYYYILILIAFMDVMFGPLFPLLSKRTHASTSEMGWIVTCGSFGNLIGTPIGGFLFHKFLQYDGEEKPKWYSLSLHKILFLNCCLQVALVFPTIIVSNFWLLLTLQTLLACTHAVGDVGANLGIGLMWREKVYPFMQLLHCVEASGYVIAPLITAQVFDFVHVEFFQLLVIVCFITYLIILAFVPLIVFPSPTAPKRKEEKKKLTEEEQRRSSFSNKEYLNLELEEEETKKSKFQICLHFCGSNCKSFFSSKVFTVHTLVCIAIGLVKGIETDFFQEFGNMIFTYGEENNLGNDVSRSYLLTSFWIVLMISRFVSVFLVIVIKDAYLILFSLAGNVLTFVIMYIFPESEIVYWLGSLSHAAFVAPLTAACFSFPQSFFGEPISSYSVAIIDFTCAFGIMTSTSINLLWGRVRNVLYLSGIFVWSLLLVIMVGLALLKIYVVCSKECKRKNKKEPVCDEVMDEVVKEKEGFDQYFDYPGAMEMSTL